MVFTDNLLKSFLDSQYFFSQIEKYSLKIYISLWLWGQIEPRVSFGKLLLFLAGSLEKWDDVIVKLKVGLSFSI